MLETPEAAQLPIHNQIRLANAWFSKGKLELASTYYQRVLNSDPASCAAYVGLGRIALATGNRDEAMVYMQHALALEPDNYAALIFHAAAQNTWERTSANLTQQQASYPSGFSRKISLGGDMVLSYHRSGWKYALEALHPLHNPEGILFDGFLEYSFAVRERVKPRSAEQLEQMKQQGIYDFFATTQEKGIVPYREPWVGFVHNPPNMPQAIDFYNENSLQTMFANPQWTQSLEHCVGLFTLSEYSASWLRQETGKAVSVLTHPTEIPDVQFDMRRFRQNQQKKIVQIGWWLRRLNAIYELPLAQCNPLNYQKVILMPGGSQGTLRSLLAEERKKSQHELPAEFAENTQALSFIPNDAYDTLLSENLVFVELYDSSANNIIIECIARATPILVNPLPPVVEYLGVDYPFYFETLSEAAHKALDLDLIDKTHRYLKECPTRAKFGSQHFLKSFANSEVYKLICDFRRA